MTPHLDEVERYKQEAVALKEKIAVFRKGGGSEDEIAAHREALILAEKSGREAQAKADAIDAAVYDLKAVNPRASVESDTRTPIEIIEAIAKHTRGVEEALDRLRGLIGNNGLPSMEYASNE